MRAIILKFFILIYLTITTGADESPANWGFMAILRAFVRLSYTKRVFARPVLFSGHLDLKKILKCGKNKAKLQ